MKQLTARNPMMNMTIVERFIDGIRYLKVTPGNLMGLIQKTLISQMGGAVRVEEGVGGWISIIKTGEDNKMKEAARKLLNKDGKQEEEIDEDYLLNKEAQVLRSQGFVVEVREI